MLVFAALLAGTPASAQSIDAILTAIYPGATVRTDQVVLTVSQRKQALERADTDIPSVLVRRSVITRGNVLIGRAYLETQTIQSQTATLMIALDATGTVHRVELTTFVEREEPRPPPAWLEQFQGMTLTDDLSVDRGIRPLAAAPFTTRGVVNAVRRALAIDAVLEQSAPR